MGYPKWATPDRQAHLVDLFTRSGGFCVFGHRPCPNPEHHYQIFIEGLISDWQADDRALQAELWRTERSHIHSLGERTYPLRGQFSAISKDIYFASQPEYYLAGLSVDGLTFKPFAKVRLASGYTFLYVSLGDILRKVSKCKRRKAIRYGRPLPPNVEAEVVKVCNLAVKHYLDHN